MARTSTVGTAVVYFIVFIATIPAFSADVVDASHPVRAIDQSDLGSFPSALTDVNGTLFFVADDGIHGFEPCTWNAPVCTPPGAIEGAQGRFNAPH